MLQQGLEEGEGVQLRPLEIAVKLLVLVPIYKLIPTFCLLLLLLLVIYKPMKIEDC